MPLTAFTADGRVVPQDSVEARCAVDIEPGTGTVTILRGHGQRWTTLMLRGDQAQAIARAILGEA